MVSIQEIPNPGNDLFRFRTRVANGGSTCAIPLFIVCPSLYPCKWVDQHLKKQHQFFFPICCGSAFVLCLSGKWERACAFCFAPTAAAAPCGSGLGEH